MISSGIEFNGAAIARDIGVSRQTFYEALNGGRLHHCGTGRHKLPPRPKVTPELVALLKDGGKTFREVARVLRTTEARVTRIYTAYLARPTIATPPPQSGHDDPA